MTNINNRRDCGAAKNSGTLPFEVFRSFWHHRGLIVQMTKREVIGRYRGSVLGLLWSFFHPILMLAVYTFVFSVVFKARWGMGSESKTEFALLLFAGLIVHALFAECVNRAPTLMVGNTNYVKKVVFPLEILPWISLGSALFHAGVSVVVLVLFYVTVNLSVNWTVLLLPIVLFPLALLTIGVSWFLASIGVYLRDVGHTISIVTTVMLFLSPVLYPVSALPDKYQILLYINPLTFIIEQARHLLIWGNLPSWGGLGAYTVFSLIAAWLGLFWFQKTRKGFADVL